MMTLNLERAAMKGKLAELENTRDRLRNRIEGAAVAIRTQLNTALTPVDDLAIPVIDELWDQLMSAWTELALVTAEIAKVKRALS